MSEFLWLLLPVAAASGWLAAQRSRQRASAARLPGADYLRGLNYLLDDRPDKAVELFVRVLDVNEETIETHLALGSVFRRRGEVDRAIQIHQNLVARPTLNPKQRTRVLLELGEDYMKAGLLDRAEDLFRELLDLGECETSALRHLAVIHQQERDWTAAIDDLRRLESVEGRPYSTEIAHLKCELAAEALQSGNPVDAAELIDAALQIDSACARAYLMKARQAMQVHDYENAIGLLECVERRAPQFLVEAVGPMKECYEAQRRVPELLEYLLEVIARHASGHLTLVVCDLYRDLDQRGEAQGFLRNMLLRHPSVPGFRKLLELIAHNGASREEMQGVLELARPMLDSGVRYRCGHCGFQGRSLHWRCPGCQHWSTVQPYDQECIGVASPAFSGSSGV